jgi:L-amino acid N-acyltransferase YncA
MITITETGPGQSDFELFLELPGRIRFKTPDLIPTDFLRTCFLVRDDGNVVARAALYDNPLLQYDGRHVFTIGNYECVGREEHASELLAHVTAVVKNWGGTYLIGPMNGSTWESYRFLTDHDNPLFFTEPYHHLYYNEQFKAAGFEPIAHYYSNIDHSLEFDNPAILAREQELKAQGVKIRPIDLSDFEAEISRVYDFNLLAFKTNFLYTPISREAFLNKYLQTKAYINPDLTLLAEDPAGNLLSYFFCIPDFYNTNNKSLIVKTLARHPAPEWRGLGHVVGNAIYRKAVELGYTSAIHAFIHEQGTSTKLSTNFSGTHYRSYVLYGKYIA